MPSGDLWQCLETGIRRANTASILWSLGQNASGAEAEKHMQEKEPIPIKTVCLCVCVCARVCACLCARTHACNLVWNTRLVMVAIS